MYNNLLQFRFPAAQHKKDKNDGRELGKSTTQSIAGRCRWDECAAQFDTSGALLEHLQVQLFHIQYLKFKFFTQNCPL